MLLISHRGNISGPNKQSENNPKHVLEVLNKYNVEIDAWYQDDCWYLGHDEPTYQIDSSFFKCGMWIHCKNIQAVEELKKTEFNWFWHENDRLTLTSHKNIWCFPGIYVKSGITVETEFKKDLPEYILGICTDYPEYYK